MSKLMIEVIEAAESKFGHVMDVKQSPQDTTMFCLRILREHPPFSDRPYMTIKGYSSNALDRKAFFEFGDYDLSEEGSIKNFLERTSTWINRRNK